MDGQTNKSAHVFYRTLSPLGPLPKNQAQFFKRFVFSSLLAGKATREGEVAQRGAEGDRGSSQAYGPAVARSDYGDNLARGRNKTGPSKRLPKAHVVLLSFYFVLTS